MYTLHMNSGTILMFPVFHISPICELRNPLELFRCSRCLTYTLRIILECFRYHSINLSVLSERFRQHPIHINIHPTNHNRLFGLKRVTRQVRYYIDMTPKRFGSITNNRTMDAHDGSYAYTNEHRVNLLVGHNVISCASR